MWRKVSDTNAVFLVTDPKGKILASLGGATTIPLEKNLEIVEIIRRVAEPAFGAQQIEDVSQQDDFDFFDLISRFGGNIRHIVEEIFKRPVGQVVLPRRPFHEMQVTDEHEHAWLPPLTLFCKLFYF